MRRGEPAWSREEVAFSAEIRSSGELVKVGELFDIDSAGKRTAGAKLVLAMARDWPLRAIVVSAEHLDDVRHLEQAAELRPNLFAYFYSAERRPLWIVLATDLDDVERQLNQLPDADDRPQPLPNRAEPYFGRRYLFEVVDEWRNSLRTNSTPRVCVVEAGAGRGKSRWWLEYIHRYMATADSSHWGRYSPVWHIVRNRGEPIDETASQLARRLEWKHRLKRRGSSTAMSRLRDALCEANAAMQRVDSLEVVFIDAVDQCRDGDGHTLVDELAQLNLPRVAFLVTSRPNAGWSSPGRVHIVGWNDERDRSAALKYLRWANRPDVYDLGLDPGILRRITCRREPRTPVFHTLSDCVGLLRRGKRGDIPPDDIESLRLVDRLKNDHSPWLRSAADSIRETTRRAIKVGRVRGIGPQAFWTTLAKIALARAPLSIDQWDWLSLWSAVDEEVLQLVPEFFAAVDVNLRNVDWPLEFEHKGYSDEILDSGRITLLERRTASRALSDATKSVLASIDADRTKAVGIYAVRHAMRHCLESGDVSGALALANDLNYTNSRIQLGEESLQSYVRECDWLQREREREPESPIFSDPKQ